MRKWINKDNKNKCVKLDELDKYLNNGWKIGKILSNLEKDRIRINKDGVTKSILKDELDKYLNDGWNKGVAYHYRWITNNIEEKWTDEKLPSGWIEGRICKRTIWINNKKEAIQIKRNELNKYLELGYETGKGRKYGLCEGSTKNKTWVNNGVDTILINSDELDKYLELGYKKGNLKQSNILKDEYKKGNIKCVYATKGKKLIYKNDTCKYINTNELDKYLNDGWELGRLNKNTNTRIWIYKNNQTKWIDLPELDKYIKDGWHSGRMADANITITNGKVDITVSLDEFNLKYKNDKNWKIGTKNHGRTSTIEDIFKNLLIKNNIKFDVQFYLNDNGKKYYYDFKIGNILVELNPSATHNVNWNPYQVTPIDKNYHYNKTQAAVNAGYRCINIWDWDNFDVLLNILNNNKSIYARKCEIRLVNTNDAKDFINKYHFQGYAKSSINIGLYYENNLVSIMTFGKPRYTKKYNYELIRYCSAVNITGGSEKLFKYFIDNYDGSIISYCDLGKFNGNLYDKLGFIRKSVSISRHWYSLKLDKHITDNLLRKHGFDRLLGDIYGTYGKGTPNEELMLQHDFVEIYDCGQATYIYNK